MKNISVTRDWTQFDWLLQSDSYNDWQLDGAVRLYLQRKPPSSKTNPSGHLCSTYPFYLAPLCLQLCSSPLHLITPSIYLSPFSPQASVSVSIHLYRFLPTNPHPHLYSCSVLYWAATAWVSPPEVTSSMRLPEDGRFTPVAQLKNILRREKKGGGGELFE